MWESQAKVNDRGIVSLAYNVLLRSGVTIGAGISLDTQKLNESAHKVRSPSLWQLAATGLQCPRLVHISSSADSPLVGQGLLCIKKLFNLRGRTRGVVQRCLDLYSIPCFANVEDAF